MRSFTADVVRLGHEPAGAVLSNIIRSQDPLLGCQGHEEVACHLEAEPG